MRLDWTSEALTQWESAVDWGFQFSKQQVRDAHLLYTEMTKQAKGGFTGLGVQTTNPGERYRSFGTLGCFYRVDLQRNCLLVVEVVALRTQLGSSNVMRARPAQ